MRITDIQIDGFGVWRDLALSGLSPGLTAFYGPNEAGKSTLMQFIRSVLYGVSAARRARFLPPVAGGRPGGWLKVVCDGAPLQICRYADRSPDDVGKVTAITADGQEQGERLLSEALAGVDEATFSNVFAVGLREVQELGTLSDTAAAEWLYRLASGFDRVSLYDVTRTLTTSRQRLLAPAEQKSEVRTLVARREQLRAELAELVTKGRRWAQSAVKLRELADEVERRQAESKSLAAAARRLEVAINLKPLWLQRVKIDDELQRYHDLRPLEEGAIAALEELNERAQRHERRRDVLRGKRHQLRDEAARLGINEALVRNGHRLEALLEQQEWLQGVERMAAELAEDVKQLEARLASERERLARQWSGAGTLPPQITSETAESLAPQARAIDASQQLLESARHDLESLRTSEHGFRAQLSTATTSGERLGLPTDVAAATDLVARLRRRQELEKRTAALRRQVDELQQRASELADKQVVPIGLFSWLLGAFVLGSAALGVWWLVPAATLGKFGGGVAAVGISGAVFAALFKWIAERGAARRFNACHRQIELARRQLAEAGDEQAQLDRELPVAEGSVAMRLEHAERHLAELERMLPVESQRREAAEQFMAAERRAALAEEKHAAAMANWQARLRALGLPQDISPADLAMMAGECERLAELETRIENRRDLLASRQRELAAVSQRIIALADETRVTVAAGGSPAGDGQAGRPSLRPLEQLDHLRAEHHVQQERVALRESLGERAKALQAKEAKHIRAMKILRRRREALLSRCGVADEQELRQLAAKHDEAEGLREQRLAVTREIAAAIGKHGSEADFAPLLASDAIGRLEHEWEALAGQQEEHDRELKDALQRRGALVEQQRGAAADHSLAAKQVELDIVEQQIEQAASAWRERAALGLLLERIREHYEKHRQPETLKEASGYLRQLTGGRYTRIWTPLGHDILFVDTAEGPAGGAGQTLPVEVLSRGTREQLFVSLRLALVSALARRGVQLPMILDDVLANFDAERTRTACAVLRDFARQGHQVLVFTCHEHVWRMFQELEVDSRRLPSRFGEGEQTDEPVREVAPEPIVSTSEDAVEEPSEGAVAPAEPPLIEPEPVAELEEIEFSWDTPPLIHASNGAIEQTNQRDEDQLQSGWLPEPLIHLRR